MNPDPPDSLWPDPDALGPMTDLYQLTMMAGYFASGKDHQRATFEMFVRKMPTDRSYLVFAGLEQAIETCSGWPFSPEQVEALRRWPVFADLDPSFFERLSTFRFEGDLWSVPEGTIVFPGEPLIRVEAPLPQAQWSRRSSSRRSDTRRLWRRRRPGWSRRHGPSGLRVRRSRGHGASTPGLLAARAAYPGRVRGDQPRRGARPTGDPVRRDHGPFVGPVVRLRIGGLRRVLPGLPSRRDDAGGHIRHPGRRASMPPPSSRRSRRSGSTAATSLDLARWSRAALDERGRSSVRIFASGDLDEWAIARLVASGAADRRLRGRHRTDHEPRRPRAGDRVQARRDEGAGRIKLSPGKKTYPLGKQVHRFRDAKGRFACDRVTRADEPSDGEPLLVPSSEGGSWSARSLTSPTIRGHCRRAARRAARQPPRARAQPRLPAGL